mmetsp:Transcript_158303/g.280657  ORF Transcript_158303/g.280657 Transcript_158303/m.280657 type:complete len:532 (-) Transcript_158303:27-1622(-)
MPTPTGGNRRIEVVILSARGLGDKNLTGGVKVRRTVQISLCSAPDPSGECFGIKVSPWIEPCGKNQWLRFGRLGLRCTFWLAGKRAPDEVQHPLFAESAELRIQLLASTISARSGQHMWAKALLPKALAENVTGYVDKAYSHVEAEAKLPLTELLAGSEKAVHSGFLSLQRCSIGCHPSEEDVLPKVWMQVYLMPEHTALLPTLEAAYEQEGARLPGGLAAGKRRAPSRGNSMTSTEDKSFTKVDGYISAGGDLERAVMSVADAYVRCKQLPGCKGFTFQGGATVHRATDQPVEIIFKNKADCHPGPWTSYVYNESLKATDLSPSCMCMRVATPVVVQEMTVSDGVDPEPPTCDADTSALRQVERTPLQMPELLDLEADEKPHQPPPTTQSMPDLLDVAFADPEQEIPEEREDEMPNLATKLDMPSAGLPVRAKPADTADAKSQAMDASVPFEGTHAVPASSKAISFSEQERGAMATEDDMPADFDRWLAGYTDEFVEGAAAEHPEIQAESKPLDVLQQRALDNLADSLRT